MAGLAAVFPQDLYPFPRDVIAAVRLDPEPAATDATVTESDGSVVPVVWRSVDDQDETLPLYPTAARAWVGAALDS